MARCNVENSLPDDAGLCGANRLLVRSATGVIGCSKLSPTCRRHTLMAVGAFTIWVFATVTAATMGAISGRCILFVSYGSVAESSTNSQTCNFSIVGESVVACCALTLVVWYTVKARCWKAGMWPWSSLVQLVALTLMLLLAVICATVITAGLQHTCKYLNDFTGMTSNSTRCNQLLPIHLYPNRTDTQSVFTMLTLAMLVTAWIVAALVLILLAASIMSITIYLYRTRSERLAHSTKCFCQSLLAACALLAATSAVIAATILGIVDNTLNFDGIRRCILFASNKGDQIEVNTNSRTCDIVFGVEMSIGCCMVLIATWFMIQTRAVKSSCRISTQWKIELWSSQVQLIALLLVFLLAVVSSTIVSIGLKHTCESQIATSLHCSQLPVTLHPNRTESEIYLIKRMITIEVVTWMVALFVFIQLANAIISTVIRQYKMDTIRNKADANSSLQPNELWYHEPDDNSDVPHHQQTSDTFMASSPVSTPQLQGYAKMFYLPCNYVPLLGNIRCQEIISAIETNHNVKLTVLDRAGSQTPINLLYQIFRPIFYVQTPFFASSTGLSREIDSPFVGDPRVCNYLVISLLTRLQWFFKEDTGEFSHFDPQLNAILQANYLTTPDGSFSYNVHQVQYTIDFVAMTQITNSTGQKKAIKCEAVSIEWQYKDATGAFVSHTHITSEAIEIMFVDYKPTSLSISGTTFMFDFANMEQIDITTCQAYTIRRCVSVCSTPTAIHELSLQVEGAEHSLDTAIIDLKNSLGDALQTREHTIGRKQGLWSSSEGNTRNCTLSQTILRQKATNYFVSALITANKIKLQGTPEQVDKVMIQLLQQLTEAEKTMPFNTLEAPQIWSPQSSDFALIDVSEGTEEWDHVQSLVHGTIPNAIIQSLERVQNKWLWNKYFFAMQRLLKKNNGIINEKELFHGTSIIPPEKILKSEYGFDFRHSSQGMWGEGAYFAVNASYSGKMFGYRKGIQTQIILAKVLTGDTFHCRPNRNLKQPPQKSHSRNSMELFEDEHYDSINGHTGGSDHYIVYDHDKAYPAYVITYRQPR